MRSVVGGDGIDGTVGKTCLHRGDVGVASQGRVHLGVGIVTAHRLVGQGEVMRRRLAGDLHAARLGVSDDARRAYGGDVCDVDRCAGELGQVHLAGHGDIFGSPGDPLEAELGRDEPFVHHPFADQGEILGVGDHGDTDPFRVLEGAAHEFGAANGLAVVGNRDAAGLFQIAHLGQALTLAPLGDGADREHVHQCLAHGLVDHVAGHRLVVDHRRGVRHAGDRGETARRSGAAAGGDVLFVLEARIAQVHVHVDESRGHQ